MKIFSGRNIKISSEIETKGDAMEEKIGRLDPSELATVLEEVPVGITVIDPDGHILYYNSYCTKFVDRKPEYIGRNISFCHQKPESVSKINKMLTELKSGHREEIHYRSERNGHKLAVTVKPLRKDGQLVGFIQSFIATD